MFTQGAEINIIIQGLVLVIIIGVFYNLWTSTRAYGGIIGTAIRLLGIGMLFITISVIEKLLINFSVVTPSANIALAQDLLNLAGLFFLGKGFSKLAAATKV